MFLNKIAQHNLKEKFDGYNAVDDSFVVNEFQGRIDLTDRFLTIYNRPTRKRVLFTDPKTPLPASGVIKHPQTGEIYILGVPRQDARWDVDGGSPYVQMSMLHLVTPNDATAGQAVHTRKVFVGPEQGWLVEQQLGTHYMDVEFRTSASEQDVYLGTVENYFAWLPHDTVVETFDTLTIQGVNYFVLDDYIEMGMCALRVAKQADPRVDFHIHRSARIFNNDTFEYETTTVAEPVTGMIPEFTEAAEWFSKSTESVVVINTDHIVFKPEVNMAVTLFDRKLTIKSVFLQASQSQWRLVVG